MSSETQPISHARFAEALKELPASALALKVLEVRNQIAHLDYSNAELKPFAEGRANAVDSTAAPGEPDQDCVDAIAENEEVIARKQKQIELVRAEVESRGLSWREFQGIPDAEEPGAPAAAVPAENGDAAATTTTSTNRQATTNGDVNGHAPASAEGRSLLQSAMDAGIVQMGTLRDLVGQDQGSTSEADQELLAQLLNRARELEDGDDQNQDGGMHL